MFSSPSLNIAAEERQRATLRVTSDLLKVQYIGVSFKAPVLLLLHYDVASCYCLA